MSLEIEILKRKIKYFITRHFLYAIKNYLRVVELYRWHTKLEFPFVYLHIKLLLRR